MVQLTFKIKNELFHCSLSVIQKVSESTYLNKTGPFPLDHIMYVMV